MRNPHCVSGFLARKYADSDCSCNDSHASNKWHRGEVFHAITEEQLRPLPGQLPPMKRRFLPEDADRRGRA